MDLSRKLNKHSTNFILLKTVTFFIIYITILSLLFIKRFYHKINQFILNHLRVSVIVNVMEYFSDVYLLFQGLLALWKKGDHMKKRKYIIKVLNKICIILVIIVLIIISFKIDICH